MHNEELLSEITSLLSLNFEHNIKNKLENSKLAEHFQESYSLIDDLNVTILQNNIETAAARRYHEGKWICKLKTLAPHDLNIEIGDCAKDMYNFY